MNKETQDFLNNLEFRNLYEQLPIASGPIKSVVTDEKLKAIGFLIVQFQLLESSLKTLIGFLLDIQDNQRKTAIITSGMSYKNILSVLSALSKEGGFHRIKDLELLISRAKKTEEIRNQLIHSIWTSGPRMKTDLNRKKGLVYKFEEYTSEDLMAIAKSIGQLVNAFNAMTFDYLEYSRQQGIQIKGYLHIP